jgi:hypothetical protein
MLIRWIEKGRIQSFNISSDAKGKNRNLVALLVRVTAETKLKLCNKPAIPEESFRSNFVSNAFLCNSQEIMKRLACYNQPNLVDRTLQHIKCVSISIMDQTRLPYVGQ